MRSMDAFGTGAAGRLERCDPKRFRRKEGGTSGLSVFVGLESAKVGDAEGSCNRMLPFWRIVAVELVVQVVTMQPVSKGFVDAKHDSNPSAGTAARVNVPNPIAPRTVPLLLRLLTRLRNDGLLAGCDDHGSDALRTPKLVYL